MNTSKTYYGSCAYFYSNEPFSNGARIYSTQGVRQKLGHTILRSYLCHLRADLNQILYTDTREVNKQLSKEHFQNGRFGQKYRPLDAW